MTQITPLIDHSDINHYEALLADFQEGRLDPHSFVGERLLRGIYAQRQEGWYMLRTKLPGGNLNATQLRGLAKAVQTHTQAGEAHVTTRQDIQLYHIALDDTPALLRLLAQHGVTTREAGGNTIRNVTTCALAGACPHELVDVTPFAAAVSRYFLHHPLTQSLPRKLKIAFSGCARDCARGNTHDLAFIPARNAHDRPGFKVLAGGGLGAKPRLAIVLEEFIEEHDLLPAIEAVVVLHDKYSDRTRRTRSRLKFLVERFGTEELRQKFHTEFERTRSAFDTAHAPKGKWHGGQETGVDWNGQNPACLTLPASMAWHDEGLVVPVNLPGGALDAEQLLGLAQLLDDGYAARLRTTQAQNLVLLGVPEARRETCLEQLTALGLGLPGSGDNVVNCPGTETCPLGITTSRRMARSLNGIATGLQLGVNGCHNGCAGAEVSDIGLIGKARRHHGQMVPSYALRLGGGEELGIAGPDIPAVRTPAAVRQIREAWLARRDQGESFTAWSRRKGGSYFHTLLENLTTVRKSEIPFLSRDQGDHTLFRVTAAGMGECAGSQANPADQLLLNAAYESTLAQSFAAKQKYPEASECLRNRLRLTAHALLLAAGGENAAPAQLSADLANILPPEDGELATGFATLEKALDDFAGDPDEILFPNLLQNTNEWVESARNRCRILQMLNQQSGSSSRASM
ncbi:nitrite/sulfite reductase [Thiolapillus sp.]